MQLSNSALTLSTLSTQSPFVALLPDGSMVTGSSRALQIGERNVAVPEVIATAAVVSGHVWVVTRSGALHRYDANGEALTPVAIAKLHADVAIVPTERGPRAALIESRHWCAVVRERDDGTCSVEELGALGADRRILVGTRTGERTPTAIRLGHLSLPIPPDLGAARVGASSTILDGSALLVELVGHAHATVVLYSLRHGRPFTRIRIGESRVVAVADRGGMAVLARGAHVALLDMRAGRCTAERILTASVAACAIDDLGASVAIVDTNGHLIRLGNALTDLDGGAAAVAHAHDGGAAAVAHAHDSDAADAAANDAVANDEAANDEAANDEAANDEVASDGVAGGEAADLTRSGQDADTDDAANDTRGHDEADVSPIVDVHAYLHALGAPRAEWIAGDDLAAYRASAHAWIESVCAVAIATKRSDGKLLDGAREREQRCGERFAAWNRRGAPHVELAYELDLSPLAATLLVLIAAPQIWCELAREYAAVTNDPSRPLVDVVLLATLLGAGIDEQSQLARELDADAPLVRSGAVVLGAGPRPYTALSAHPALARRLAGATIDPSAPSELLDFGDFIGPCDEVIALACALEQPRSTPPRIALRGKSGAGRRTVAAMLAARAGRDVDVVSAMAPELAQRLRDCALRGHIPVVDLDGLSAEDDQRATVRIAIDEHVGPLFVRAARDADLPFTVTETVSFLALSETERAACWRLHLDDADAADALAERYAIGPGAIARAAAAPDPIAALRASRGQRVARLAERVDRLAKWDDLVVTSDVEEALRELVGRVRFRRTVLETWGMGDVATTARGVTALFQGGPGTGKTMAAGVIARALGYELWRVDLSKVVSKWIGETERNLGMLFDAAEEGEIVLLFDEADALFTKRTEVKSSNDKHANAATNYLLQRLDSFTGIAILTTNFGTAIDTAFRRRLAVQVELPFPDEQERLRLWQAHLPKALPTRGDLQLQELAETYQLSGGYIRNAALRAAYLAAGRATSPAITADDLRRAITLEKDRVGRLGNGRIE